MNRPRSFVAPSAFTLPVAFVAFVALAAPIAACGDGTPAARGPDPIATVDAKLRGTWRLVDYRPEVPLEPNLKALIDLQMQSMVVRFEGDHLIAESPTFHWDRPYVLSDVADPMFKLTTTGGEPYTSSGQFDVDGRRIFFRGESEPWRGSGTLQRQ